MALVFLLRMMALAGAPFWRKTTLFSPIGLDGVDLSVGRGVVVPRDLFIGRDFGDGELVGEEDVAVGEHEGVADFSLAIVGVGPGDLAAADDEHAFLLCLARVEEVVLG